MAIEQLITQLRKDAADKEKEILIEAETEAKQIIKQARITAENEHEEIMKQASTQVLEENVIQTTAKLKAKQIIWKAKSDSIKRTLDELADELKEFANSKTNRQKYSKLFEKLSNEAVKELAEKSFVISCRKVDFELAKKFGKVSNQPIDCIGGFVISSEDATVRIDCTFESLIEQKTEELSAKSAIMLDEIEKPKSEVKKVKKK